MKKNFFVDLTVSTVWPFNHAQARKAVAILLWLFVGVATTRAQGGPGYALSFDGTNDLVSTSFTVTNPQAFTLSVWFKTTTTRGGRILGFGNSQSGTSTMYDRAIYMSDAGRVLFGVYSGAVVQSLSSSFSYNDGGWHQATATFSTTNGMKLFVDAQLVDANAAYNMAQVYNGWWRLGGDSMGSWPSQPTSSYFAGLLDEVQIWNRDRPQTEIQADLHRVLAGNELGLTVLYHLDENSGTMSADSASSDGANAGTLLNGPVWTNSGAPVGVPAVMLNGATNVSPVGVTVNGLVNPNFQSTSVYMQYGTTTNYGAQSGSINVGNGGSNVAFSITLNSLTPGTTYQYRLSADSAGGTARSTNASFTTLSNSAPSAVTLGFSVPTVNSVNLDATVNPSNAPTTVYFQYGGTTNYGSTSSLTNLPAVLTPLTVSIPVTGLSPGTIQNFRVVATNLSGVQFGNNLTFATLTFTNVSFGPPDLAYSASAWGDFDNDGLLDLLVSGNTSANSDQRVTQIWRNLGNGTFTNIGASLPGLGTSSGNASVAWGDYDNDGFLDILLTGATTHSGDGRVCQIWRNLGNGSFTNIGASFPGIATGQAAWGDFDQDGWLDVVITGQGLAQVWRNTGSGFVLLNLPLDGRDRAAVAVGDFDNDGFPDLAVSGVSGYYYTWVWRNNGNLTFSLAAVLDGLNAGSLAWFDADNDGFLDLLATGSDNNDRCILFHNNGDGTFSHQLDLSGISHGDAQAGDYDNDGRMDIALQGPYVAEVWRNMGSYFTNIQTGLPSRQGRVAWGDYDRDGRLDLTLGTATYRQFISPTNTPPVPPSGLSAVVSGNSVLLSWGAGSDAQTPVAALSYNIRVGTNSGGSQIVSPQADISSGFRRLAQIGNAQLCRMKRVTKLTPGTKYYWSAQTVDGAYAGSPFASEGTFFVPFAPTVTTMAATLITSTAATLQGTVHPNSAATTYCFNWGTTTNLGNFTVTNSASSGPSPVSTPAFLSSLLPGTIYYYQLIAANAGGTNIGAMLSFTSSVAAPYVATLGPTAITRSSGAMHGSVASNGLDTAYFFQYGLTTNYGSTTPTSFFQAHTSLQLNGTNQFAQAGAVILASTSFTIELWLRHSRTNSFDIALFQGTGSPNQGLHLGFRPNNVFTFAFWGNDLDTPASYTDTDWHHWACTYHSATRARMIYRDGSLVASNTASANYQGAGNFLLGYTPAIPSYFAGAIDEVSIWNGVRTANQIAADMNAPTAGAETGLKALWHLDEGTGSVAADASGNGFTAMLSNAPIWAASAPVLEQGTLPASFAADALVSNLVANSVYHYRIGASNSLGTTFGIDQFFRPIDITPINTPVAFTGFNADAALEPGGISLQMHGNFGWFAAGMGGHADGLPMNTSFSSVANACGSRTLFQLGPANATNALKLGDGFATNAPLSLTVPAAYNSFSVLASSGNGGGLPNLTFHFVGGSNYVVSWNALDWCVSCGNRRQLGLAAVDFLGRNSALGSAPGGTNYGSGFTYERNADFGLYETKIDLAAAGFGSNKLQTVSFNQAASVSTVIFGMSGKLSALPVSIVEAPTTNIVCVGDLALFDVRVDHSALASYQWQRQAPGQTNFVSLGAATNLSYTTPVLTISDDNSLFRVVVTGPINVVTSAPALLRVLPTSPSAPLFSFNFGSLPTNANVYGSAYLDSTNGALVLTSGAANQSAALVIADPAPGRVVRAFTTSFKALITPASLVPGEGFSFNWATNVPNGTWSNAEEGLSNGLSVSFDIYDDGGNEAPAIDLKWNGVLIAHQLVSSNLLVTGTNFTKVFVRLYYDATLDLFYGCQPIYSKLALPPAIGAGLVNARFAFGARTSGNRAIQALDDFALEVTSVPVVPLAITQQPAAAAQCPSGTATFTVAVNDPPQVAGYQWQRRVSGGTNFINLPGATNVTYITPALTSGDDLATYRVLVNGFYTNLISAEVELRVPSVTSPTVSYDFSSAPANTAIYGEASYDGRSLVGRSLVMEYYEGTGSFIVNDPAPGGLVRGFTAAFQVAVDSAGEGGYGFSFNWATNLPNAAFGQEGAGNGLTVAFHTLFAADSGNASMVVAWNGYALATAYLPYSDIVRGYGNFSDIMIRLNADQTLDVFYRCQPIFLRLPVPASPVMGGRFGFGARSTGGLYELWQMDNLSIQLDIDNTPQLNITRDPQDVAACPGGTASLDVGVNYPTLVSYQWQSLAPGASNFIAISNATNGTYVTPPLTLADVGTGYRVLVTGLANTATSAVAQVAFIVPSPGVPAASLDFNSGLPTNAAVFGSAYVNAGALELNTNATSQIGSFILNDPVPGQVVSNFTARFKLRLTGITTPPADGFSFNWATNLPNAAFGEDGAGSGLTLSFDTYDNGGGEAPAVDILWNGTMVAHRLVPLSLLLTGTNFVEVFVRVNADATLDLVYGCQSVYAHQPVPGMTTLTGARFGLGGRSTGLIETHSFDDFTLEFGSSNLSLPVVIGSASRTGSGGVQLTFTNSPGAAFSVLATTNLSLPLANWILLGAATEVTPGSYRFTDLQSTNAPFKFYKVRSP